MKTYEIKELEGITTTLTAQQNNHRARLTFDLSQYKNEMLEIIFKITSGEIE